MKTEIIQELFGIDKLDKEKQITAVSAFNELLKDDVGFDESIHARIFLHALGVHKLNENFQTEMIKRTAMVVEALQNKKTVSKDMFKWNSISECYAKSASVFAGKIKKNSFHWGNKRIAESVEKIKKSEFHWGPDTNNTTLKS